jgi:hypothetical protein
VYRCDTGTCRLRRPNCIVQSYSSTTPRKKRYENAHPSNPLHQGTNITSSSREIPAEAVVDHPSTGLQVPLFDRSRQVSHVAVTGELCKKHFLLFLGWFSSKCWYSTKQLWAIASSKSPTQRKSRAQICGRSSRVQKERTSCEISAYSNSCKGVLTLSMLNGHSLEFVLSVSD